MASKAVAIKKEVVSDLASRFLINIPDEDRDDPVKLCFHLELAYWFYLDINRPEDPSLPACSMKEFMATVFQHCPFLVHESVAKDLNSLISQWKSHKYNRPIRGVIILNHNLTKCILVQGYPAATSWGFPKGKLEEGESDKDAAVREAYEETGFDIRELIREDQCLEAQVNDNTAKMYIIPGVAEDMPFAPRTRKEISAIQWFRIDDLPRHKKDLTSKQNLGKTPNAFFMIIPFMTPLRKWITSYQQRSKRAASPKTSGHRASRGVPSASFMNPTNPGSRRQASAPNPGPVSRQATAPNSAVSMFPSAIPSQAGHSSAPVTRSSSVSLIGQVIRQEPPWDGSVGPRAVNRGPSPQMAVSSMRAGSAPTYQHHTLLPTPLPTQATYHHYPTHHHAQPYPYGQLPVRSSLQLRNSSSPLLPTPSPSNHPLLHTPSHQLHPGPHPFTAPLLSYHYSMQHRPRAVYPGHLSHAPPVPTPAVTFPTPVNISPKMHAVPNLPSQTLPLTNIMSPPHNTAGAPPDTAMADPTKDVPLRLQPCYNFQGFTFDKKPILACLK